MQSITDTKQDNNKVIITALSPNDHKTLAVIAAELNLPRNVLYRVILEYAIRHSNKSIAQMVDTVSRSQGISK